MTDAFPDPENNLGMVHQPASNIHPAVLFQVTQPAACQPL
jgi:hypothetical protein